MVCPKKMLLLFGVLSLWMVAGCKENSKPQPEKSPVLQSAPKQAPIFYSIAGGPGGGSFNSFANGISILVSRDHPDIKLLSEGSPGSMANLKSLERGAVDLAIVNMTDAVLARTGSLSNDPGRYEGIRAVAFLYSSLAQIIVRANSPITSVDQLIGRRVAVGNPGSESNVAAQRFLTHLGLWDKIEPVTIGFQDSAIALRENRIDALLIEAGWPNPAVHNLAQADPIRLIPLAQAAPSSGFLLANPFYSLAVVPANTYPGQAQPIPTFAQAIYLCAGKRVPDVLVAKCLKSIYSPETLLSLKAAAPMAKSLTLANGLKSCLIPIHQAATKFWAAQGVYVSK